LNYIIFKSFLKNKKESCTIKKARELSYKVLKFEKELADMFLRGYAVMEFREEFREWLKKSASTKSKKPILLRIDGSKTGYKYGKNIPELRKLYDYVKKCNISTHEIYILLASIGRKDFIVDLKIKAKQESVNDIAIDMLHNFIENVGDLKSELMKYKRLSLDGAWGNGNMLKKLKDLGITNTAIKSSGKNIVILPTGEKLSLKDLEEELKSSDFKQINSCHGLNDCEYTEIEVYFPEEELSVKVVLYRFKHKHFLMLLSLNLEWHAFQILQCYKSRWGIEVCFRTSKQVLELEKYSYHSVDITNIRNYLALKFMGYMLVNWYRVDNTRLSLTSLKKVRLELESLFYDMQPKTVQMLFLG